MSIGQQAQEKEAVSEFLKNLPTLLTAERLG